MRPFARRCGGAGRRAILLLAALLALSPLAPSAQAAEPRPALQQALDAVVAAGAPGVLARVDDRRIGAWRGASGVADLATQQPLRPAHRYRIGSVSKSFVAVVALQLVDEGRLSLSDTVAQRLPGILPYGDRVTLRQLLQHTAGVPDYVLAPVIELYTGDRLRSWTPQELVALVAGQPQQFPSGTSWSYSNTGYVLAGLMIEAAGGRPLGREIRRRILRPLRLRDTSFPVEDPRLGARHSRGYSLAYDEELNPIEGPLLDFTEYNPSLVWAAGNLVSNAGDVARFYRALLRGRLLSPARLADMKSTVAVGPGAGYGLGLTIADTPCGPLLGHNGGVPGFVNDYYGTEDGARGFGLMINAYAAPAASAEAHFAAFIQAAREVFAGEPCAGDIRAAALPDRALLALGRR